MKKMLFAALFAMSMASSGCATIINGTDQKVFLRSDNPKTSLYVDGKKVGEGQGFFIYQKNKSYTLKAELPGCKPRIMETTREFDKVSLVNPILTPIDLYTGAAMKPSMDTYVLNPTCTIQ
ncbi:TPA: hypothetical protein ACSCYS_003390 [Aeromonas veronii]